MAGGLKKQRNPLKKMGLFPDRLICFSVKFKQNRPVKHEKLNIQKGGFETVFNPERRVCQTATTSSISGRDCFKRVSMPSFRVKAELGQPAQAP